MKRLFLVFGVGLVLVVGGLAVVVFFRSDNTVMIHSRDGGGVVVQLDEVAQVRYVKDDWIWNDKGRLVFRSGKMMDVGLEDADAVVEGMGGFWGGADAAWKEERVARAKLKELDEMEVKRFEERKEAHVREMEEWEDSHEERFAAYMKEKGEMEQLGVWNCYKNCMMLKRDGFLKPTGNAQVDESNRELYDGFADKVREWVENRKRMGLRVFPDAEEFEWMERRELRERQMKLFREHYDRVFCGDMARMPLDVRRDLEDVVGGEWGDDFKKELRARSLLLGWALEEGGYDREQVKDQVGFVDRLADRVRAWGGKVDEMSPAQGVYEFMSEHRKDGVGVRVLKAVSDEASKESGKK